MPAVTFYFDLGSPYAHLAAARLHTVLPEPVRWQPVLLGGLFRLAGRSSWALGDERRRRAGMAGIERRAHEYGLAPVRWPDPWPADYLFAMRAATFAFEVGLGREFTRSAFGDAFERGADLSAPARVLDAGRRVGIAAAELEAATRDPHIRGTLRAATEAAHDRGVLGVPTVAIGDALFWGDDRLEDAAAHLRAVTAA
jgi:2-hydroxychromene-2-carboxylate isomerase